MSTPTYSSQQQSHHHSQQQQYQHQSSLSSSITVPANIQKLLDNDLEWNFDVIELERISDKWYDGHNDDDNLLTINL